MDNSSTVREYEAFLPGKLESFWFGVWCLIYFSYIVAVSFIGGGNWNTRRKPLTCCKWLTNFITLCCIKYTPPQVGFKLTALVVIGTDCTDSCKSNYHTITSMTAPKVFGNAYRSYMFCRKTDLLVKIVFIFIITQRSPKFTAYMISFSLRYWITNKFSIQQILFWGFAERVI